jgi:hypothetical protein
MPTGFRDARRTFVSACITIGAVLTLASCDQPAPAEPPATSEPPHASSATSLAPLVAPKTTTAEDSEFLTDVTEADPALVSYEQQQGNVALRALLTAGSAFCAFLGQGEAIDSAMVDVAAGAHSVESQTHLPSTVTTFNTIEAVALLTLCPADLKLVPAADQSKIRNLGVALGKIPG